MDGSAVEVWNAATALGSSGTVGPEVPTGTAHLARLLRCHNAAMGGGLGFALEVTAADQLEAVASAADYLDLVDVARLVRRLDADGRDFDLAEGLNDAYCEATGETRVGDRFGPDDRLDIGLEPGPYIVWSADAGSGGGPGFELALTQLTPARQERP